MGKETAESMDTKEGSARIELSFFFCGCLIFTCQVQLQMLQLLLLQKAVCVALP